MKYVDVIIDNKSEQTDNFFTYGCTDEDVQVGQKVYVTFGKGNKLRDAYVFHVKTELENEIKGLKYIESLDPLVCLNQEIVDTCIFMKKRYLCKMIDAVKCFTPSGTSSKRGKKRIPYNCEKGESKTINALTNEQEEALKTILPAIEKRRHERFLIHGVTSSGKTEVYMRVIDRCISEGRTAIMLVPEISLTKQIIERFFGRFGAENIAVLHSKLSYGERYDEWMRIRNGQVKIVIGARSAVFAPMTNIGAIILDEEHETSYKSDMTPKYDTAEIGLIRAKASNGILILGSATPSVSSYQRAEEGIYRLITMKERYNKVPMPAVEIVDMRAELLSGNRSIFSDALYQSMKECLEVGKQAILFLNRRGYSTFVSCRECGYVMKCDECNIALTYHKEEGEAVCHYCGRSKKIPAVCPECGSKYIKYFGTGTEKVEEAIKELFEDAVVDRFDLDTIKKKGSIDRILGNFQKGRTDILIGTQLVAKGLDFENVGLVGVVSADVTLNIPDFRSAEKTFQLITQAAGRAGRGTKQGNVVIQSYTPSHYAIASAAEQNFNKFYNTEIEIRKNMGYPPYCDFIQVLFSSEEEGAAMDGAKLAEMTLRKLMGSADKENIFKPAPAPLYKMSGTFRYNMLIKCPKGKRNTYSRYLEIIKKEALKDKKKKYNISVDINPYSFM